MIALLGKVTVLLEYIDRLLPIMPALCSMLLVTYYAFNYAGIIGRGLLIIQLHMNTCIMEPLYKFCDSNRTIAIQFEEDNLCITKIVPF